jgi:hypothetical protein
VLAAKSLRAGSRLAWLLLVLLAVASRAAAQPATGTISGTVTGDQGTRLAGVTLTIQSHATGVRYTVTTDQQGRYELANLPADGEYLVAVALPGFTSPSSENVTLVPNATLVVNFRLKLSVAETAVVAAQTPLLEGGQSSVEQTVNERLVHALPLVGRSFIPLATLTAGFTGNPNYPSPQGQIFWTNNLLVDGASHFSKWRSAPRSFYSGYGLESIKDVRVLSDQFSVEYGESLATVTTAVTKSGTNDVHGSALFFLQDDMLNATPTFATVKPPAASDRYGFTIGGPFAKDRTYFFESYEGRRSRGRNIVVSPNPQANGAAVPDDEDEHLAFFRVDHRLGDEHNVMGRYNGQFFRWHDEPGGLSLPGTGTQYRNDVHTILASDRMQLSDRLLNEVRVQFARFIDVRNDLSPTVYISRSGYSIEGGAFGPFGYGADPEDTLEAADTMSFTHSRHALKLGGGFKYVRDHNAFTNYGRGAYFFAGAPDFYPQPYLFVQGVAPTSDAAFADPRSLSGFGFVQDDWKLGRRATLKLGLRYDVERVSNVRNFGASVDKDNLQPRIGIAWEPSARQPFLVRGGAGLYTQQHLLFYINRVQLEGVDGTQTIALSPSSPLFPHFPNVLPNQDLSGLAARDIQRVDATFNNPYSLQATFGVERSFRHVTLSADYLYLNGRDLMSLIDINAPASNPKPNQRSVAEADATRPIPAVPGSFRNIVTLGNLGESWYRALQIKVDRSTGSLQAVASYTLSRAEDLDNYQLPEDSRNLDAERARANPDVHHNLTAGLTWQMPSSRRWLSGWSLSGIGVFRSNRPYTITWGDDRNGTTQNDARPDGRNTAETDSYQNVDVSLARRFTRGATAIEGRIEAFNIFNTTNYDEYVGALLSPLYGRPVTAFPSRRVQLAAVVRF